MRTDDAVETATQLRDAAEHLRRSADAVERGSFLIADTALAKHDAAVRIARDAMREELKRMRDGRKR